MHARMGVNVFGLERETPSMRMIVTVQASVLLLWTTAAFPEEAEEVPRPAGKL